MRSRRLSLPSKRCATKAYYNDITHDNLQLIKSLKAP